MFSVAELANIIEEMAAQDFSKQPMFMFMEALIGELVRKGLPVTLAEKIVFAMDVKISEFDSKNEDWNRIVKAYAVIIIKLQNAIMNDEMLISMASKLSIKYEA